MPVEHKLPNHQIKGFADEKSFTARVIQVDTPEGFERDIVRVKIFSRVVGKTAPFYLMGERQKIRQMLQDTLILLSM